MIPIRFQTRHTKGQWEYHLAADRHGFLDRSVFDAMADLDDEADEEWWTLLSEFGLVQQGNRENSLLYAIAIRRLSRGQPVLMASLVDPAEMGEHFPEQSPLRIEWLPGMEFTTADFWCRDLGCLRPAEFLRIVDYSSRDLGNRYYHALHLDTEAVQRYIHLYGSDVTSWVFLTGGNPGSALDLLMNDAERPSIEGLIAQTDCLVQLQIGEDEGYLDYLKVSAGRSLDTEMAVIETEMNRFAEEYETFLSGLLPVDEEWKIGAMREFLSGYFGSRA